jgi:UDP-2,4-diacetamido-2,4,6-trideoxy-beta-L-altropyranose hydrolase
VSFVFRVDASFTIGIGHVMRCLTLADELRHRGAGVMFVCRELTGHLVPIIKGKGYPVVRLPQPGTECIATPEDVLHASWMGVSWMLDAAETIAAMGETKPHWLIIDHYAIDRRWEEEIRPHVGQIMVIDYRADRPHDCDLLLDQNLYQAMESRYDNLTPATCKKLLGPTHVLLRPEFAASRKTLRRRDGQVRRVLVFYGGVDSTNETGKALQALAGIADRLFEVDAVVGGGNTHKEEIQRFCEAHVGFHYHCQVDDMAKLMAASDLAIGGGGTTTWERCFLGLPTIAMIVAENQTKTTVEVARKGAAFCLGYSKDVDAIQLARAIENALANPAALRAMSENAMLLMGAFADISSHLLFNFQVKERM